MLVGEVIRIEQDKATVQVYEETGMQPRSGVSPLHANADTPQPVSLLATPYCGPESLFPSNLAQVLWKPSTTASNDPLGASLMYPIVFTFHVASLYPHSIAKGNGISRLES